MNSLNNIINKNNSKTSISPSPYLSVINRSKNFIAPEKNDLMTVAEEGQDSNPQSKVTHNRVGAGAKEDKLKLPGEETNYAYESTHVQKASNMRTQYNSNLHVD